MFTKHSDALIWFLFFLVMLFTSPEGIFYLSKAMRLTSDFGLALSSPCFMSNASWQSFLGDIATFSVENSLPRREECLLSDFGAQVLLKRSPIWWLMSVMSALGKLREEDRCEFEASLGYIARSCLKVKRNKGTW